MKVLIDLTSLDDNFSGIERFALNISKNLIMQDYNNKYILLFKNKIHNDFESIIDNSKIVAKVLKGKNKLIFNQIILPYNLYKIKADKYLFLAFPSPILFRKSKIINTIHDLTCWDYPKTMKFLSRWYFRLSIKNAIKVSKKIITVSNFSKNQIVKKFGNKDNLVIIYNGISSVFENFKYNNDADKLIEKKYLLGEDYILSLGTVEPRKNLSLLIEAFKELKMNNSLKNKLVIVGRKGWKINEIIESCSNEIKNDIVFTGFVNDNELPYIYKNAAVFVFPSLYEGFGIPPIEALAMKTKVITSDIEVFKETLGENSNMFKSNNKEDLKKVLLKAINNNDEQIFDLKIFSWKVQANKLLGVLNEL